MCLAESRLPVAGPAQGPAAPRAANHGHCGGPEAPATRGKHGPPGSTKPCAHPQHSSTPNESLQRRATSAPRQTRPRVPSDPRDDHRAWRLHPRRSSQRRRRVRPSRRVAKWRRRRPCARRHRRLSARLRPAPIVAGRRGEPAAAGCSAKRGPSRRRAGLARDPSSPRAGRRAPRRSLRRRRAGSECSAAQPGHRRTPRAR